MLSVRLFDLPQSQAFVLFGLSATTSPHGGLPLEMTPFGMPGCYGAVRDDAYQFVAGANGQAAFSLAIPAMAQLVGAQFFQQALVLDPAAGNALGAVMSDAYTATIGR